MNPNSHDRIGSETFGGVVLCGGQSKRMGIAKSALPFGECSMLECVIETLVQSTTTCVVVGYVNEALQETISDRFADAVVWADDENESRGPMEGIRVGLKTLAPVARAAFVTSCDVPLLKSAVVNFLRSRLGSFDAVLPTKGERVFGLTAVYRTSLHQTLEQWVLAKRLRVSDLIHLPQIDQIEIEALRPFDRELESIININSPQDYLDLLARKKLGCPPWVRAKLLNPPRF